MSITEGPPQREVVVVTYLPEGYDRQTVSRIAAGIAALALAAALAAVGFAARALHDATPGGHSTPAVLTQH